jgi:hypothetical protein
MARPRKRSPASKKQAKDFTHDELVYLAGIWDGTIILRGTAESWACVIAKKDSPWPAELATTYGGEGKPRNTKGGKEIMGWEVDPIRRLELFLILEEAGLIRSLGPYERDGIRGRLQKAASAFKQREEGRG